MKLIKYNINKAFEFGEKRGAETVLKEMGARVFSYNKLISEQCVLITAQNVPDELPEYIVLIKDDMRQAARRLTNKEREVLPPVLINKNLIK